VVARTWRGCATGSLARRLVDHHLLVEGVFPDPVLVNLHCARVPEQVQARGLIVEPGLDRLVLGIEQVVGGPDDIDALLPLGALILRELQLARGDSHAPATQLQPLREFLQRARREYMAAEDRVKLDVRQSVRTLQELAQRLQLRRRGVRIAARQLEFAQTQSPQGQQGINIIWASYNLLNAQDETIETWLDYESTRLNLFRDTGTMEIDEHGIWKDPFYQQMVIDKASGE